MHFEGDGLLARCLQHETDHTLGTVFGDRLPTKARKKLQKQHDKAADDYPPDWPAAGRDRPTSITSRNARFQQWEALLHNRTKRHRLGEFLVQGVRPISLAIEHGWTIRALICDGRPRMSTWAAGCGARRTPSGW